MLAESATVSSNVLRNIRLRDIETVTRGQRYHRSALPLEPGTFCRPASLRFAGQRPKKRSRICARELRLYQGFPPSPQRFETEISLQSNLAVAYTAIAGWSDPNVYGPHLFKHSLASARKLKVVGWELRSTIDLARLLASEGSHSQASKLLTQVLRKFPIGETSIDIREGSDLLRRLTNPQ